MVSLYDKWKHTKILELTSATLFENTVVSCNIPYFIETKLNFDDIRFSRVTGESVPYRITEKTDGVSVTVELKLPINTTKVRFHYGNSSAVSESSDSDFILFNDGLESGNTNAWDVKTSSGTCGIRTDSVYAGTYSIGSDQSGGNGSGQSVYDQNHTFVKVLLSQIPVGSTIQLINYAKRWYNTAWAGHFCGFGYGDINELDGISADNIWRKYTTKITRNAENTWSFIYYVNDVLTNSYNNRSYTFTTYFTYGIQTRHNDAGDNSIYFRMDNATVTYIPENISIRIIQDNVTYYSSKDVYLMRETNFHADVVSGYNPTTVQFTDESIAGVTSWSWNFGDGQTSTDQNPSHQYTAVGIYDVSLTVTIDGTEYTETKNNYITILPDPPVANFIGNSLTGDAYHDVQFTDQSTNSPNRWSWNFGDGQTSIQQNPSHRFIASGTYTVSLTAYNTGGSDSETKTDYIVVTAPEPPVANFSADDTDVTIPTTVQFTDLSTHKPISWLWDFGDGGTSTLQNPTHVYDSPENCDVSLTATNETASDTETKTDYILVSYYGKLVERTFTMDYSPTKLTVTRENSSVTFLEPLIKAYLENHDGRTRAAAGTCSLNLLGYEDVTLFSKLSPFRENAVVTKQYENVIYNTPFVIDDILEPFRINSSVLETKIWEGMYRDTDKMPLIAYITTPNGNPIPLANVILEGRFNKDLGESDYRGIMCKYVPIDVYTGAIVISQNYIVYTLASMTARDSFTYDMLMVKSTKANATYRQLHRKFV